MSAPELSVTDTDRVRELLRARVASDEIDIPVLPEIAARVVALASSEEGDTRRLTQLITADQALASNVMRVATTASFQPTNPITSLPQAITWLGMTAVADIAFTVAMQSKILNVPGHKVQLLAMWREAVAAGTWAREIAGLAGRPTDAAYLQGLLHEIGKPIVVHATAEVAARAGIQLGSAQFLQLAVEFEAQVGERVVTSWKLPAAIAAVVRCWRDHNTAGEYLADAAITGLAHRFADFALNDESDLVRESISQDERHALLGLDETDVVNLFNRTERLLAQVRTY